MWLRSIVKHWGLMPRMSRHLRPSRTPFVTTRLRLEQLENRLLPSTYLASSVADLTADINAANLHGGANTIVLAQHTTFTLTAADNATDGANGLPVVAANDNLTILGNGDTIERSTAAGTPAFRLFDVASGGALTLKDLTLQHGLALGSGTAAEGGAALNQGTLTLTHVTVQNNVAQGSIGVPGTPLNPVGGNGQDASGGGIWSSGILTLQGGSNLLNNQAIGGDGGPGLSSDGGFDGEGGYAFGGGLDVAGGTVLVANSTLSSNSAQGGQGADGGSAFGGAMFMDGAAVTLSNVGLSSNFARGGISSAPTGGGGDGGAVFCNSGTLAISRSSFASNSTYGGNDQRDFFGGFGGPCGYGGALVNFGAVTIDHSTFSGNSADFGGGAIDSFGTLAIHHSDFEANTSGGSGGALWNIGRASIDTTTLSGNSDSGGDAGAIYNLGSMTIDRSTLSGNYAYGSSTVFGGAIDNNNTGTLTVSYTTLSDNQAISPVLSLGGAIVNSASGTVTVEHSTLTGNTADGGPSDGYYTGGYGGAIASGFNLTVDHSILSGNSATGGGGAIYNDDGRYGLGFAGVMTVENSTLSGNSAGVYGGAIASNSSPSSSTPTVSNCILCGNTAVYGGAFFNGYFGFDTTISSSIFSGNSASYGGAFFNTGGLTIAGSLLVGNSAASAGGGIYNDDGSFALLPILSSFGTLTLDNSTVSGNFSPLGADLENAGATTLIASHVGVIDGTGSLTE
jgi:hypothetical protein